MRSTEIRYRPRLLPGSGEVCSFLCEFDSHPHRHQLITQHSIIDNRIVKIDVLSGVLVRRKDVKNGGHRPPSLPGRSPSDSAYRRTHHRHGRTSGPPHILILGALGESGRPRRPVYAQTTGSIPISTTIKIPRKSERNGIATASKAVSSSAPVMCRFDSCLFRHWPVSLESQGLLSPKGRFESGTGHHHAAVAEMD